MSEGIDDGARRAWSDAAETSPSGRMRGRARPLEAVEAPPPIAAPCGVGTLREPTVEALFARVVHGLVTHASDTAERLGRVLARDPGHVGATCLRGFAALGLGQNARLVDARAARAAAGARLAERGGSPRDRALVTALGAWVDGAPRDAASRLAAALDEDPTDLLLLKLEHGCRFMIGDSRGMRDTVDRVRRAWSSSRPGYGYVLGMASFGAVETGDLTRAERLGREALAHAPDDAWGAHAVAHVHEMRDRAVDGDAWLERCREAGTFAGCNNFGAHVAWHLALFCLARGDVARALALYDDEVIAVPPGDFRDVSNASSLLWRLERDGVDVGDRWDALLLRVRPHLADHGYAFADAHYALVLVESGRLDEARAQRASLRRHALRHRTHSARVQRTLGRALVEGIVALAQGDAPRAFELLAVAEDGAPALGGSHAQRDLFRRLWVHAAERSRCAASQRRAVDAYLRARPASAWAAARLPESPEIDDAARRPRREAEEAVPGVDPPNLEAPEAPGRIDDAERSARSARSEAEEAVPGVWGVEPPHLEAPEAPGRIAVERR